MTPALRTTVAAALLCLAATASAADASPWTFRLGPAHVGFSAKADVSINGVPVPGGDASASSNTTLGFELAHDLTDRWTARLLAGIPPRTTLSGEGALASAGTLGKVTYGPAALTFTYRLPDLGPVQPHVGAGVNYTIVFKSEDGFIAPLDARSAWGSVLHLGATVPIDALWSVSFDARKIYLKTQADGRLPALGGASAHADVRLDPLVLFLSVGRRF